MTSVLKEIQNSYFNSYLLLELETRVAEDYANEAIRHYANLMTFASSSQFHGYLPWGQR